MPRLPGKGTGAVGETVKAEKRGSCSATLLGVYVDHLVGVRSVSYTHLTLPTKLEV